MKILFFGNCHLSAIGQWMYECYPNKFEILDCKDVMHSTVFNSTKNFAVWMDDLDLQKSYIKKIHEKIKQADFFVFQPIENKAIDELRPEFLIENVVRGSSICVPNTRFFGYPVCSESLNPFIQYVYNNITTNKNDIINYIKNANDSNFERIITEKSTSSISENRRRYNLQAINCLNKIEMNDFIEENWKKHLLFGTHNHPIGVYWESLIKKLFIYFNCLFEEDKFKYIMYPNKNKILNIKEFSFFNHFFPDIVIPSNIQLSISLDKVLMSEKFIKYKNQ